MAYTPIKNAGHFSMMSRRGLEPPPCKGHTPQACASADSATGTSFDDDYTDWQQPVNCYLFDVGAITH